MKFLYKTNWTETVSIKERLAFIDEIDDLPSMPSVVLPLMSRLNNPYVSVSEIEKLINMDPGLVSYILKLTNSLLFGLLEEVYSISRAIILLGMSNLRSIVTSYTIRLLCRVIRHSDVQEYLWNHSLSVGVIAKVISEKVYGKSHPHAYVFGLLHDLGKIVLYVRDSRQFQESLEQGIVNDLDFVTAEKNIFGFSHIEAGFFMIDKLRFSRVLKDIILFHHDPEYGPAEGKMHWIIGLSNELSHNIYDNKPIELPRFLVPLELSEEELVEVIMTAQKQVEQYRELV